MAYNPVTFAPGVVTDVTEFTAEARWHRANRIRFRDGLVEPIGGWQKFQPTAVKGIPRRLHSWGELDGTVDLAIGTEKKLLLIQGGEEFNITPIRETGTLGTDPFTTTDTSDIISVADTSHGLAVGTTVSFSGAATFNGVTIDGEYDVLSVTDSDNYTIQDDETATATGAGGGASVSYSYEINIGQPSQGAGFGWGAGEWGGGTWGTARATSEIILELRLWSLSNWGEDLLAAPRGDKLYQWDASVGTGTRATVIAASPLADYYVTSPDDQHVIALGADSDPMKIKWCDQGDFTNWTISTTTTAGERFLRLGSKILGGLATKGVVLIWTDRAMFTMRFVGGPFTFSVRTAAVRGVLIGPGAMIEHNDVVYWMGDGNFWIYDGRMRSLPCTVLRQVFDDIDLDQTGKVIAGLNEEFHEVWWFYPSASGGTGENDRYAKYNFRENVWDYGDLDRTAWLARDIFATPLAGDATGFIYEHEIGQTDDAGNALGEFIESGEFDIAESERIMLLRNIIPDMLLTSGSIDWTLMARKYPQGEQLTKGPYTVTPTTKKIAPRVRGRRVSLKIDNALTGTVWRTGKPVVDVIAKGRR